MKNRVGDVYVREITDSKGRLNGRKASNEGKENWRLFQHSKGEGVEAWKWLERQWGWSQERDLESRRQD